MEYVRYCSVSFTTTDSPTTAQKNLSLAWIGDWTSSRLSFCCREWKPSARIDRVTKEDCNSLYDKLGKCCLKARSNSHYKTTWARFLSFLVEWLAIQAINLHLGSYLFDWPCRSFELFPNSHMQEIEGMKKQQNFEKIKIEKLLKRKWRSLVSLED